MASFFDRIQYTEEAHSTESESESAIDLFPTRQTPINGYPFIWRGDESTK